MTATNYARSQDWWKAQQFFETKLLPTMSDEPIRKARLLITIQAHFAVTKEKFYSILDNYIEAQILEEVQDGKSIRKLE